MATSENPVFSDQTYVASSDYILRDIAGEAVLIPIGEGANSGNRLISLNATSAYLWKQFQCPKTIAQVVQEAAAEFDVDLATLERDITDYVKDHLRAGVLKEN